MDVLDGAALVGSGKEIVMAVGGQVGTLNRRKSEYYIIAFYCGLSNALRRWALEWLLRCSNASGVSPTVVTLPSAVFLA
jgi:hypothetical protein